MKQSREEYFSDIKVGKIKYYTIGIEKPDIKADSNNASITYTAILKADAYGARGTFRMLGTHYYEKIDDKWIAVNEP